MKKQVLSAAISLALFGAVHGGSAHALSLEVLGSYATGLASGDGDLTSGETVAVRGTRMYVTNASDISVDIVDITNPAAPALLRRVDLSTYGGGINSIDVSSRNLVAIAVQANRKTDPGTVVFMTPAGKVVRTATVGALPDMLVFTHDGRHLVVANEGEPDCYGPGCTDPHGTVSVVTVVPMKPVLPVQSIGFEGVEMPAGVRVFGPGASVAADLEPEYVTLSRDGDTAWVSLQENNAIAVLDLATSSVSRVFALGYKDHGEAGSGLDASDRDGAVAIQPWARVRGMYQPDAIASFSHDGEIFIVSANEGDARDYPHPLDSAFDFGEELRARDLRDTEGYSDIPGIADTAQLGRLTVSSQPPVAGDGNVYAFGARSISIWNGASGERVWDSGEQLEQQTAAALPGNFNSNNDENNFDNRSDNKGPEPEGVALGVVDGTTYAFVGLERIGGLAVFDLSEPRAPRFVRYVNNRAFIADEAPGPDSGPEVIRFVAAHRSPLGQPMVVVANEVSGTVTLWGVQR